MPGEQQMSMFAAKTVVVSLFWANCGRAPMEIGYFHKSTSVYQILQSADQLLSLFFVQRFHISPDTDITSTPRWDISRVINRGSCSIIITVIASIFESRLDIIYFLL